MRAGPNAAESWAKNRRRSHRPRCRIPTGRRSWSAREQARSKTVADAQKGDDERQRQDDRDQSVVVDLPTIVDQSMIAGPSAAKSERRTSRSRLWPATGPSPRRYDDSTQRERQPDHRQQANAGDDCGRSTASAQPRRVACNRRTPPSTRTERTWATAFSKRPAAWRRRTRRR